MRRLSVVQRTDVRIDAKQGELAGAARGPEGKRPSPIRYAGKHGQGVLKDAHRLFGGVRDRGTAVALAPR